MLEVNHRILTACMATAGLLAPVAPAQRTPSSRSVARTVVVRPGGSYLGLGIADRKSVV